MDVEQEDMQFLGIFGILRETIKLIYTWRRIFTQITLALILPLSFLFFAYMELTNLFVAKITHDQIELALAQAQITTSKFHKLPNTLSSERIYYLLFSFAYLIVSITFSLLSTSAVVYTVACIYTARDVTFKQVMRVVPKVWKRLLLTFLCVSVCFFAIGFVFILFLTLILVVIIFKYGPYAIGPGTVMIILFFSIFFILGITYLTIIWQLSNTISVLEESYGFKAMAKSKALMKGKRVVAAVILVLISLPYGTSQLVLRNLVVQSVAVGVVSKGILGILCLLLLSLSILLKLVADVVLYFVCKSYHRESIDKLALSEHLQVYVSTDYVPLKLADDVQLMKLQV